MLSDTTTTMDCMLTTDQKGAIAEAAIVAAAIEAGIGVARPFVDERYDLIFDTGAQLLRVQCKWASCDGEVVAVRCYSTRRDASGFVRRAYVRGEVMSSETIAQSCVVAFSSHSMRCRRVARSSCEWLNPGTAKGGMSVGPGGMSGPLHWDGSKGP